MESVFSNVPDCKLHTWVKVVSTTHASQEIQEQQFFETFQNSCFNYLARHFSHAIAKAPCLSGNIYFPSLLCICLPVLTPLLKT